VSPRVGYRQLGTVPRHKIRQWLDLLGVMVQLTQADVGVQLTQADEEGQVSRAVQSRADAVRMCCGLLEEFSSRLAALMVPSASCCQADGTYIHLSSCVGGSAVHLVSCGVVHVQVCQHAACAEDAWGRHHEGLHPHHAQDYR
jgi:hypothetical protein